MLSKGSILILTLLSVVLFLASEDIANSMVNAIEVKVMPDSPPFPGRSAYAWVGRNLPIWGKVIGGTGTYTYEWDINDDGTPEYSGNVSNPKHIMVGHTYSTAGTYFARLTVKDSANVSNFAKVRIQVVPAPALENRVEAAIQDGLRYLYLNQQANGSWYGSPYASGSYVGGAGIAVLAFEEQSYLASGSHIFAETIQAGLNYILGKASYDTIDAASDLHNGNLKGVRFETPFSYDMRRPCYEVGITMMAIVASGISPADIIAVGPLAGQTYQYAMEEATDWNTYAQNDTSSVGGWRYTPNYGSADNSVSQWPAIGLEAAELWGIKTPAFVKDRLLNNWLKNSQNSNGGFGYDSYGSPNMPRTGGGLCELAYCDVPTSDTRVQKTLGYLANGWLWTGSDGNRGNMYAIYGVAKGARISNPPVKTIGSRNWQDDYNQWLVADQQYSLNGGSRWNSSTYGSNELNTGFAVLVLSPGVIVLPPVANAGPDQDMPPNTDINFDGTGSYHHDPGKSIVKLEWDIDNSDGIDFSPPDLTGSAPTLAGGYPEIGHNYSVTVTLLVTDNVGATDTDTMVVNITSANVPPVADAGGPYFGDVGQMITFDGSGSYDPNEPTGDKIVKWEWDMDGDGLYDDASGKTVQWSWPTPHSGVIGLKVTDSLGASGTASAKYTTVAISELWIVKYRWSTLTKPPYKMTPNPDGTTTLVAYMSLMIENRGNGDAFNVIAKLAQVPDYVTILDGNVTISAVPAKSSKWSSDDFGLKVIYRGTAPKDTVWWDIEWDDAAGHHNLMQNVPMFGP